MNETNKKCRMCKSEIAADAKKCPYCKSFQMWVYRPFTVAAALILVYAMFMLMLGMMFADFLKKGEAFKNYQDKLVISQSELTFGKKDNCSTVVVIGKIQNQSHITWQRVHFQINCYNSENKLFDTKQSSEYDFLVPRDTNVPFKVSFTREFPEAEYKRHEVTLIDAEQKDRW
jgi:hypothetical protein